MRRKLVYQINLLSLIRKKAIRQQFNELDLYCGQEHFVRFIGRHPGCKQSDIAEAFHISPASVSISTGRLEKMGIINKETSETRIRENNLYLTSKGEDIDAKIKEYFDKLDQQMFKNISDENIANIENILDNILFNLTGKTSDELDIRNYINEEEEALHARNK